VTKDPCPVCKGRCCKDYLNYRLPHMGDEFYAHTCNYCKDGTIELIEQDHRKEEQMISEDNFQLRLQAVASPNWEWVPGMRWILERPGLDPITQRVADSRPRDGSDIRRGALPDLDDDATKGCLLGLLRKVYRDPSLYVRLSSMWRLSDGKRAWEVIGFFSSEVSPDGHAGSWRKWGYASEEEALVSALVTAPLITTPGRSE
jgi:hypothetical protein